jgi:hypothetical protein
VAWASFLVSHNDLGFSKEMGEQFYLYRVFLFRQGPRLFTGFYPVSTDGLKRAENFRSCLATLRRIRGL